MSSYPQSRSRRLRRTEALRRQVAETRLHPASFVLPLFVVPGRGVANPIGSMPGQSQLSVDELIPVVKEAARHTVVSIASEEPSLEEIFLEIYRDGSRP